jgi:adenylate cyclase
LAETVTSAVTSAAFSDARILIVDDEPFHLGYLERLLRSVGYSNISTESDPRDVEDLHREQDFDLILLDVHMPHLTGIEVIERLKKVDKQSYAPVIILTGDTDLKVRDEALERGARDFLVKPPRKEEMLSRIRNILEIRHLNRQNQIERERYHQLLQDILPNYIVERLKNGESEIVDDLPDVSILFADLVGFSSVCARLESRIVVENVNRIFLALDDLAERYDIEKIKTLGDAYMAVSGIGETGIAHFQRMADFAIAAIQKLESLHDSLAFPFQMRIGIERGQLIAGVLKGRRSVFDVWGDTVNAASRLQSASSPGRVLVSRRFADAIEDRFVLEPKGFLELKGVGQTEALFVLSRK